MERTSAFPTRNGERSSRLSRARSPSRADGRACPSGSEISSSLTPARCSKSTSPVPRSVPSQEELRTGSDGGSPVPFVVPHLVVGNGEVEPTCAKASTPPRNRGNFTHEARQSDRPLI